MKCASHGNLVKERLIDAEAGLMRLGEENSKKLKTATCKDKTSV